MTLERMSELLDAYGARPERWPDAERDAGAALVAGSRETRARRDAAAALDTLLDRVADVPPSPALARRILAGAPRPTVVPLSRRRRVGVAAALGLAAAASLAVWLVRQAGAPRALDPAALAQLDDYETATDELLAVTDLDSEDALPAFGCDDPEVDCDAEAPPGRPSAAQPPALEETLA
jgi:hypothetical protein